MHLLKQALIHDLESLRKRFLEFENRKIYAADRDYADSELLSIRKSNGFSLITNFNIYKQNNANV